MNRFFFIWLVLLASSRGVEAQDDPKVGDRVHITGCENGVLQLSLVNVWDSPQGRIVGQLSGDGRADHGLECAGSVVILRERRVVRDRVFFRIDAIIGSTHGWLTDSFIGRLFKIEECDEFFEGYPAAQQKCREG